MEVTIEGKNLYTETSTTRLFVPISRLQGCLLSHHQSSAIYTKLNPNGS